MTRIILPGLIDPHVHLRTPGQTQKEDFTSGTKAAIFGGFTTILDMPNNKIPITTAKLLRQKMDTAKKNILCDLGFYFGSLGDNLKEFPKIKDKVLGLKLYLNQTTGNFLIDKKLLSQVFLSWTGGPILLHAEKETVIYVIELIKELKLKTKIHFCHISRKDELKAIIKAKENNINITCGVTPHHLFLTDRDNKILKSFGEMKPPLSPKKDVDFLWANLRSVDTIESDHAPHTIDEKKSQHPPFGVPGLETTLPLLITAVFEKRLSENDIIRLCSINPGIIFGVKQNKDTYIEVDTAKTFVIQNDNLHTKCKWSPFNGKKVRGKILRVFIRKKEVMKNDTILVNKGFGRIIYAKDYGSRNYA